MLIAIGNIIGGAKKAFIELFTKYIVTNNNDRIITNTNDTIVVSTRN